MTTWLRQRFRKMLGTRVEGAVVHVTAFGKHPAWDDHIDDVPLATGHLAAFQQSIYTRGIGENIGAGTWSVDGGDAGGGANDGDVAPAFDHWLAWHVDADDVIVARMWSSVDGKGRTSYPMVLAAHVCDAADGAARSIAAVVPALTDLESAARATLRRADVLAAVDIAAGAIRSTLASAAGRHAPVSPSPITEVERSIGRPGLERVWYEVKRSGAQTDVAAPFHVRVPRCATRTTDELALWATLNARHLCAFPILSVAHVADAWVDLLGGSPGAQELACLRLRASRIPLTTTIPYTIDEATRREVDQAVRAEAALPPPALAALPATSR